jgi:hypothetical protein
MQMQYLGASLLNTLRQSTILASHPTDLMSRRLQFFAD